MNQNKKPQLLPVLVNEQKVRGPAPHSVRRAKQREERKRNKANHTVQTSAIVGNATPMQPSKPTQDISLRSRARSIMKLNHQGKLLSCILEDIDEDKDVSLKKDKVPNKEHLGLRIVRSVTTGCTSAQSEMCTTTELPNTSAEGANEKGGKGVTVDHEAGGGDGNIPMGHVPVVRSQ